MATLRLGLFSAIYLIALLVFLVVFCWNSRVALAHPQLVTTAGLTADEATWIAKNAAQCCGIRDCVPVGPVREGANDYAFPHPQTGARVLVPAETAKRSPSGRDLACFVPVEPAPALGDFRWGCLFLGPRA